MRGLWKWDNPYQKYLNNLCKKIRWKSREYFKTYTECMIRLPYEKKSSVLLIVGENHEIGTSNLDNLLDFAINDKIVLFLEGSFKLHEKSILSIPNKMFMDNSYQNIHFLDRKYAYLFSYLLQIRETISYLDFIEKIPENQKEIDSDFQELGLDFFYFLVHFYLFYYRYIDYFIQWSPTIFSIIKDNYQPLLSRKNMEKKSDEVFRLIGAITGVVLTRFEMSVFKLEINRLIRMSVLSSFEPFDNIVLPPSISLSKLLDGYNNKQLFTESDNYYKYWKEINLFLRDRNFAQVINDKKSRNKPNVVICGFFHTEGVRDNLLDIDKNIHPFIVDNRYILTAIGFYL